MNYKGTLQDDEGTIIALVSYIANQKPEETNDFLLHYGYRQSKDLKELETNSLQFIVQNADDEKKLIAFLKLHPDKNLIIENYKNGNLKSCSCGCDECDGRHDAFYRQEWFLYLIVLLMLIGGIYCIVKNSN